MSAPQTDNTEYYDGLVSRPPRGVVNAGRCLARAGFHFSQAMVLGSKRFHLAGAPFRFQSGDAATIHNKEVSDRFITIEEICKSEGWMENILCQVDFDKKPEGSPTPYKDLLAAFIWLMDKAHWDRRRQLSLGKAALQTALAQVQSMDSTEGHRLEPVPPEEDIVWHVGSSTTSTNLPPMTFFGADFPGRYQRQFMAYDGNKAYLEQGAAGEDIVHPQYADDFNRVKERFCQRPPEKNLFAIGWALERVLLPSKIADYTREPTDFIDEESPEQVFLNWHDMTVSDLKFRSMLLHGIGASVLKPLLSSAYISRDPFSFDSQVFYDRREEVRNLSVALSRLALPPEVDVLMKKLIGSAPTSGTESRHRLLNDIYQVVVCNPLAEIAGDFDRKSKPTPAGKPQKSTPSGRKPGRPAPSPEVVASEKELYDGWQAVRDYMSMEDYAAEIGMTEKAVQTIVNRVAKREQRAKNKKKNKKKNNSCDSAGLSDSGGG